MRFGLSPDANPIAAALDSYSKLSETFNRNDRAKREQQDYEDQTPLRSLEIQSRTGQAKAQIGQQEEDASLKAHEKEDRPYVQQIHGLRAKIAQASIDGTEVQATPEEVEAGIHIASKSGFNSIHEAAQVTSANAQLAQILPGVHQEVVKSIQSGQKQGRIDNPQLINLMNQGQVFGKQPVSAILFDENGDVVPVGPGGGRDKSQWGENGKREDGSQKGYGFKGMVKSKSGKDMSEYSLSSNIDGKEVGYPSIVPSTTPEELEFIKNEPKGSEWQTPMGKAIQKKAQDSAMERLKVGKSPFAADDEVPPQPFTDENGNVIKIPSKDLYQKVAHLTGAAPIFTAIGNQYEAITDPKKLAALEATAATAKSQRSVSKTQTEFLSWLDDNKDEDKTVTEQRAKLSEIAGKYGVDNKTAKELEKNVIQEKVVKPRNLQKLQSGASDVLIDPDAEGGPKEVWKGSPKPKQETGGGESETKRDARRDKYYKEAVSELQKDEGYKGDTDKINQRASEIADARMSGKTPAPDKDRTTDKKIAPLKEKFKNIPGRSLTNPGGTDKDYLIESARKLYSREEIERAAKGTDMEDAVKEHNFELPPIAPKGTILVDHETGKKYKSNGREWKEQ